MFALGRMKKAIALREKYFSRIQTAFDLIKEIEDDGKAAIFQTRAERIDEDMKSFESAQETIITTNEELEDQEKIKDVASVSKSCDELYFAIKTAAKRFKSRNEEQNESSITSIQSIPSRSKIKLPRIDIPQFSGDLTEWTNFHTLFETLVHLNSELSKAEKFHYLRGSLKGPALRLIESLHISEGNYQIAYDALLSRYNCKRRLANLYIEKITNVRPLNEESVEGLQRLTEVFATDVLALQALDLHDLGDLFLLYFGLKSLDPENRKRFEDKYACHQMPTFDHFSEFIEERRNILEIVSTPKMFGTRQRKDAKQVLCAQDDAEKAESCALCQGSHRLSECPALIQRTPKERYQVLKERVKGVCYNCFAGGHISRFCRSKARCHVCQKKHHSLLHSAELQANPISNVQATPSRESCSQEILSTSAADSNALLGTATALIKDRAGRVHPLRMVIDCGAQRSFITSRMAENLRLKMSPNPHGLRGFGGAPIAGGQRQARCVLLPRTGAQTEICTEAVVIPKICSRIPNQRLPHAIVDSFRGMVLADEKFYEPSEVDFLLGADRFLDVFNGVAPQKEERPPSVMETIFGAVVMGPTPYDNTDGNVVSLLASSNIEDLPQIMEKFWRVEEVAEVNPMNPLDMRCEEHFCETHTREKDGRYKIRLPFKEAPVDLGPSKPLALLRFYRLEDKFRKNKELKLLYDQAIREYIELGFISRADAEGAFYLPHHGVLKEGGTTKLRIVFDASASTKTGSLNDRLLVGPKLQLDIKDVLLGFRTHPIALTSDISKMFLQVIVDEEDRKYQHFLYRFDKSAPLQEYRFNRLSFGMSCSPYIALRVVRQLIEDEGNRYSLASKALKRDTYVDDILTGADSIEEAEKLKRELIELLNRGGFTLKGWSSNDARLTQEANMQGGDRSEKEAIYLGDMEDKSVKVLGMQWEPKDDVLTYRVRPKQLTSTKRGIMSTIARMYDPLGYLAPVIFKAKVVLQKLWRSKLEWDDPVPQSVASEWQEYYEDLPNIEAVAIPRCLVPKSLAIVDVVGFADASSDGYAAVLYLRMEDDYGNVSSHLMFAKTKLAPLKSLTIPRLELCAAQLLVKALKSSEGLLERFTIRSTYLLSDSKTVLSWMKTPLYKLHTFVTNRVHWILERSEANSWYHVPTQLNAADVASRGIAPKKLVDLEMWWKGPSWVKEDRSDWPITRVDVPDSELPEIKQDVVLLSASQDSDDQIHVFIERQSSYLRLVRAFAYVRRFVSKLKGELVELNDKGLQLREIHASNRELVKLVQRKHFNLSIEPKTWKEFQSLSPFLDTHGIVRVGGRLANAPINDRIRHPILLPARSHFTKLVVDYYHQSYMHPGPQLLHSLIRQTYWIPSARRFVRARCHQCSRCHRASAKTFTPLMADLPRNRFNQERPFINVGTDFAGPFTIRESRRRKAPLSKAYVCIFICLSVKAVHLEIVSQLSTEAFLACLDRFIARRGLPKVIFSDNGTNFVGANRQLKELFQWWITDDVQREIRDRSISKEIEWKFSPPSAPHFGGIWEAGVKSFKHHFTRVVGSQNLTFEEMSTVVTRIEAILNSRPLHPLGSDPDDMEALTPGHFLIGMPMVARIEEDVTEIPDNRLSHWQRVQAFVQQIWRRWRQDYLHELQQRKKWSKTSAEVEEGTMVIIKTDNTPPLEWPIGRIIECYKGGDNVVRVVKVKTAKGEFVRPLVKLAPLFPCTETPASK